MECNNIQEVRIWGELIPNVSNSYALPAFLKYFL